MKEWIVGRNPVYEMLRAGRRNFFRLHVATGVEEKGRLSEILRLAAGAQGACCARAAASSWMRWVKATRAWRWRSAHTRTARWRIFWNARKSARSRPLCWLLDLLQNPQNLGTLFRTAEAVGVHGILIPLAARRGGYPGCGACFGWAPASICW